MQEPAQSCHQGKSFFQMGLREDDYSRGYFELKQLWVETSWDDTILAGYLYFTICVSLILWSKSNVICQNQSNFSISSWLYLSLCSDNQIPIIVLSPQLSLLLFWILSWFPPALQSQYHHINDLTRISDKHSASSSKFRHLALLALLVALVSYSSKFLHLWS